MVYLPKIPVLICFTTLLALIFASGCTSMTGFSGIYVSEEYPDEYWEFRGDGTVYSRVDGTIQQVARWTRPEADQLRICHDEACLDMAIGETTIYYYQAGKRISMVRAEKIPDPTPTPVRTAATPAYPASSDLELVGNVFGIGSSTHPSRLDHLQFTLGAVSNGNPVDVSQISVSFSDGTTNWPAMTYLPGTAVSEASVAGSAKWGISKVINPSGDATGTILSGNTMMNVVFGLPTTATANARFSVILKTPDGSELRISRTMPAELSKINILY